MHEPLTAPAAAAAAAARSPACWLPDGTTDDPCPRCGNEMTWTKVSWHCLVCRYKEGCC